MSMVLPSERPLEEAIEEVAQRQGTTPELLALEVLRERFLGIDPAGDESGEPRTLADLLRGSIGLAPDAGFPQGETDFAMRSRTIYGEELEKRWEGSQR